MMSQHSVDNDTLSCSRDLYTNMPRCLHLLQLPRAAFASPHSLPSPSKSAAQQSHMAFSSARMSTHISDTHPPNNICMFGSLCVCVHMGMLRVYVYMDQEIVCQRLVQTCAHQRVKNNNLGLERTHTHTNICE